MFTHRSERGYVALEFALAMGLLVLPTALILLQIPSYLEQKDRVTSIAAVVAQECANKTSTVDNGQSIALTSAQDEMAASTSLSHATLVSATCSYETNKIEPGTRVRSTISISAPAAVVPGLPQEFQWTMTSSHDAIIPKYRSVDEP